MLKEQLPKITRRRFLVASTLFIGGALLGSGEQRKPVYDEILRVFGGEKGEKDLIAKYIADHLEKGQYLTAGNNMKAKYYASGLMPEERNPEMHKLIDQVRDLARQTPDFNEADWLIEEDNHFYADITRVFGAKDKSYAEFILVCLEEAKTDAVQRQDWYRRAGAIMSSLSVAGPFTPENRNPEMLELLGQLKSLAQ